MTSLDWKPSGAIGVRVPWPGSTQQPEAPAPAPAPEPEPEPVELPDPLPRTHAGLDALAAERGAEFPDGATVAEKQAILEDGA